MSHIPVPAGPEEYKYKGSIVAVVTKPMKIGDTVVEFEHARRSPGTRLIFVSSDNKILITEEHRGEVNSTDYRLPGGKVFDKLADYLEYIEAGKDILEKAKEAAKVESEEETGLVINDLEHFHTSKAGATIDWDLFYFVIRDFAESDGQKLGLGEDIKLKWHTPQEVEKLALSGDMKEDRSVGVLLRFLKTL